MMDEANLSSGAGDDLAPIALFAFRRPDHTRRTLAALAANKEAKHSLLYAFCDGPKREADVEDVQAVRRLMRETDGFAAVKIVEHQTNIGLANSIIGGVSAMLADYPQVIVVEDDLATSPHFLGYMNQALRIYADEAAVASIHGYIYPVEDEFPATFFLRGADCWGWATWRRAWAVFEPNACLLAKKLRERGLDQAFDMDGAYPYMQMLQDAEEGKVDSWAIRWHASAFLENMLTLYPGRSLVQNIGTEGSGTHGDISDSFEVELETRPLDPQRIAIEADERAADLVAAFLRKMTQGSPEPTPKKVKPAMFRKSLNALWRRLIPKIGRRDRT